MRRWYEWTERRQLDWPTLLELLTDMVANDWPVVATVGDGLGTHFETEGCLVAHQHRDGGDGYLERESFGLSSRGRDLGGFSLAPGQFREASLWSADGMDYFTLEARFENLVLLLQDQSTHGTESGLNHVP
jgi:hypothetical protein